MTTLGGDRTASWLPLESCTAVGNRRKLAGILSTTSEGVGGYHRNSRCNSLGSKSDANLRRSRGTGKSADHLLQSFSTQMSTDEGDLSSPAVAVKMPRSSSTPAVNGDASSPPQIMNSRVMKAPPILQQSLHSPRIHVTTTNTKMVAPLETGGDGPSNATNSPPLPHSSTEQHEGEGDIDYQQVSPLRLSCSSSFTDDNIDSAEENVEEKTSPRNPGNSRTSSLDAALEELAEEEQYLCLNTLSSPRLFNNNGAVSSDSASPVSPISSPPAPCRETVIIHHQQDHMGIAAPPPPPRVYQESVELTPHLVNIGKRRAFIVNSCPLPTQLQAYDYTIHWRPQRHSSGLMVIPTPASPHHPRQRRTTTPDTHPCSRELRYYRTEINITLSTSSSPPDPLSRLPKLKSSFNFATARTPKKSVFLTTALFFISGEYFTSNVTTAVLPPSLSAHNSHLADGVENGYQSDSSC